MGKKMKKDILDKMAAEVLSQMVSNEDIFNNFSTKLKKKLQTIGTSVVLAGLLAIFSGFVHADKNVGKNMGTGLTISGLFGVLANESKPTDVPTDCDVQGVSGWKVGAGSAIGTLIGNQFGKGSGNTAATIVGAIAGAALAQSSENERIRRECVAKNSQRKIEPPAPSYPANTHYSQTVSYPQSPILYQGRTDSGKTFYVTTNDSPGIAALTGKTIGYLDVEDDLIVKNALEQGLLGLEKSYENLDQAAQKYIQVSNGNTTISKLARYAVSDYDITKNSHLMRERRKQLENAKNDLQNAYNEYARKRSVFAHVADNAAIDGYDIRKYGYAIQYLTPPESVAISFDGKLPNRYAVINSPVRP